MSSEPNGKKIAQPSYVSNKAYYKRKRRGSLRNMKGKSTQRAHKANNFEKKKNNKQKKTTRSGTEIQKLTIPSLQH
jgi:hypothetical protein